MNHLSRLRESVCLFILGAVFVATVLFVAAEVRQLRLRSQRDYGEGHVAWLSQQILDTSKAYRPLDRLPYVVYPYPPLYMLASRLANLVHGDLLEAGRGVSLLSTLGIAIAVGFTILFSTSVRAPVLWRASSAVFGGGLVLLSDSAQRWGSLMRVDMLALFLMYAGLGVYIGLGKRERWQYVAAGLFVLALFTKQTMLSAPFACLTFGWLMDRRRTMRVAAFAMLFAVAVVVWLDIVTHGGFLTNIVAYNENHVDWGSACVQWYGHLRAVSPLSAIAAATVLGSWNRPVIRHRGWIGFLEARSASPYGRAVIMCGLNCVIAAIMSFSIGKVGASLNHLLAWDIAMCLLGGLFLYRLLATWIGSWKGGRTVTLVCAGLLLGLLSPSFFLLSGLRRSFGTPDFVVAEAEVVRMIRETPGPVFSENLLLLVQARKPVEVEPATVSYLANDGNWNQAPYVDLFDRQYFGLLVTYDIQSLGRYSPAVTLAIERAYVREQQIGDYTIYRPRQTGPR